MLLQIKKINLNQILLTLIISANKPAAVTLAPAPAPLIING